MFASAAGKMQGLAQVAQFIDGDIQIDQVYVAAKRARSEACMGDIIKRKSDFFRSVAAAR